MAQHLNPFSGRQFIDANGNPISGGRLFVYAARSTTKVNTTKDKDGVSNHQNPIILNTRGEPADAGGVSQAIWQTTGQAVKLVLAPPTDTDPPTSPISTWDDIVGINDTAVTIDEWVLGPTPTFVSATSFTLVGDQTLNFHIGRRIKSINSGGTRYSTITNSVFTSLTTVTVVNDSGSLDSGLSSVSYGLLSSINTSVPSLTNQVLVNPVINFATGIGQSIVKRKNADESVSSSATLQDDDHLFFSIAANEEWSFQLELDVGDAMTTAGGIKVAINAPAGATIRYSLSAFNTAISGGYQRSTSIGLGLSFFSGVFLQATARVSVVGWVSNGANAGTIQFQWAQGVSNATATTIKTGSWMRACRIA